MYLYFVVNDVKFLPKLAIYTARLVGFSSEKEGNFSTSISSGYKHSTGFTKKVLSAKSWLFCGNSWLKCHDKT
jgi:hypothetical protein